MAVADRRTNRDVGFRPRRSRIECHQVAGSSARECRLQIPSPPECDRSLARATGSFHHGAKAAHRNRAPGRAQGANGRRHERQTIGCTGYERSCGRRRTWCRFVRGVCRNDPASLTAARPFSGVMAVRRRLSSRRWVARRCESSRRALPRRGGRWAGRGPFHDASW